MYIAIDGGTELNIRFLTEANSKFPVATTSFKSPSEFKYSSASNRIHTTPICNPFGLRPTARLPIDVGRGGPQVNKFEKGRSGHTGTAQNRLIDTTENITFPQLRLRAVIINACGYRG